MPEKAHIVGNELRRRNPTTILRLYLQKRDTETEKPRQKSAVFSIFSRRTVCALRARGKSHAGLLWIAGFLVVGVVVAFLFTFCFQSKGQLCCCFYQNILASRYKAQVLGWHLPFGVLASSWARCAAGTTLFSLTFFVWLRRHWIDIRNQTNTSWSGLDLAHWHAYLVQLALGLLPMTFTAPTRKQRQNFFFYRWAKEKWPATYFWSALWNWRLTWLVDHWSYLDWQLTFCHPVPGDCACPIPLRVPLQPVFSMRRQARSLSLNAFGNWLFSGRRRGVQCCQTILQERMSLCCSSCQHHCRLHALLLIRVSRRVVFPPPDGVVWVELWLRPACGCVV